MDLVLDAGLLNHWGRSGGERVEHRAHRRVRVGFLTELSRCREIAALKNGFLLITGEANSDTGPDNEFRFYRWQPGHEPEFAGTLPAAEGKAEGLYVLDETAASVDVLVIFDSGPAGGPHAYRLARP